MNWSPTFVVPRLTFLGQKLAEALALILRGFPQTASEAPELQRPLLNMSSSQLLQLDIVIGAPPENALTLGIPCPFERMTTLSPSAEAPSFRPSAASS